MASKGNPVDPVATSLVAAGIGLLLVIVKLGFYLATGSLVVALSAWDSLVDCCASFINAKVIRFARSGVDKDHPYGHGKAESLAAFGQGALIVTGGLTVFAASIQAVALGFLGKDPEGSREMDAGSVWWAGGFFAVAFVVTQVLSLWLKAQARRTESPALAADGAHYQMDALFNIASVVSLGLVAWTGQEWLDGVLAMGACCFVIWSGSNLLRETLPDLMDEELPEDFQRAALQAVMDTHEDVLDIHGVRCRRSGSRVFFDFHVTLPSRLTFREVHDIVDSVEALLRDEFGADAVVHPDPDCLPVATALALARSQDGPRGQAEVSH